MPADDGGGADLATVLQDYVPRSEYEAALDAINAAYAERDEAVKGREADSARLKDLETKHRSRAYRDAYDKVRKDDSRTHLRVKDEFADDVFRLLELQQDQDEPDSGKIASALEAFLKQGDRSKSYLQTDPPKKTVLEPGEGSARGRSVAPGEPELRVTRQQLNDAMYMRDNQSRIAQATRAGLLVIDD